MFIMLLFISIVFLVFGILFKKAPPKDINSIFGYRTSMSMKNTETWSFAHRYCGRIWTVGGCVTLPVSVIAMLSVLGQKEEVVGYVGIACLVLCFAFILASIIVTEIALNKNFDSFGNRRVR